MLRSWRKELLILGGLALATTAVFWVTDLDIRVSRLFFVPDHPENVWHHGELLIWQLLYESDDYLTAALCTISITYVVIGALRRRHRRFLLYGLFMLLSVAIGAGLIVNVVLKEHWGHPRPSDLVEFGGDGIYLPPLAKGPVENGESFPSGHAAIGFSFFVFWFIWRGRHPGLARKCFAGALALGALLGLGRIIQGRHFLSDVLWAAYIPYLVCIMLYYFAFRFPARDHTACAQTSPGHSRASSRGAGKMGTEEPLKKFLQANMRARIKRSQTDERLRSRR